MVSTRFGRLTGGKFPSFRRNLFIKTEPTPNPNSLIYRPENRPILGNDSRKLMEIRWAYFVFRNDR